MFPAGTILCLRDSFPDGEGLNRRLDTETVPAEAQDFLAQQKKAGLDQFHKSAIFMINRYVIEIYSFNFLCICSHPFRQQHFMDFSFRIHQKNLLVSLHSFNNYENTFWEGSGNISAGCFKRWNWAPYCIPGCNLKHKVFTMKRQGWRRSTDSTPGSDSPGTCPLRFPFRANSRLDHGQSLP